MNYQRIIEQINTDSYLITGYALKRMAERGITTALLEDVIRNGEIIEIYEDEQPYSLDLILSLFSS